MSITRKPTEAEVAEAMLRKPIFKTVRVQRGALKSLWVVGTTKRPCVSFNSKREKFKGVTITYRRGELSENGRYGIFCCRTLESAKFQMHSNGSGRCRVYESHPIGQEINNDSGFGSIGTVLYPAIILGKRAVYSEDVEGWS